MTKVLLAAIVVVAISIGLAYYFITYFNFGVSDPRSLLMSYTDKFENVKNIRITYNFRMSMLSGLLAAMGGVPDFQIEYYKLNGETKTLTSFMGATSAIYTKGDIQITCTEGSPLSGFIPSPASLYIKKFCVRHHVKS